ncbi:hypothetical protein LI328DRAFT_162957 [Trichoderma asperelloides]|nr:hypothetical protein LI328DRAFT_162957 [Trichoderma asperelloides]
MVPLSADNMSLGQLWLYKHTRSKGTMQLEAMARIQKTALPVFGGFIRAFICFLWDFNTLSSFFPGLRFPEAPQCCCGRLLERYEGKGWQENRDQEKKTEKRCCISLAHTLSLYVGGSAACLRQRVCLDFTSHSHSVDHPRYFHQSILKDVYTILHLLLPT